MGEGSYPQEDSGRNITALSTDLPQSFVDDSKWMRIAIYVFLANLEAILAMSLWRKEIQLSKLEAILHKC